MQPAHPFDHMTSFMTSTFQCQKHRRLIEISSTLGSPVPWLVDVPVESFRLRCSKEILMKWCSKSTRNQKKVLMNVDDQVVSSQNSMKVAKKHLNSWIFMQNHANPSHGGLPNLSIESELLSRNNAKEGMAPSRKRTRQWRNCPSRGRFHVILFQRLVQWLPDVTC